MAYLDTVDREFLEKVNKELVNFLYERYFNTAGLFGVVGLTTHHPSDMSPWFNKRQLTTEEFDEVRKWAYVKWGKLLELNAESSSNYKYVKYGFSHRWNPSGSFLRVAHVVRSQQAAEIIQSLPNKINYRAYA